MVLSHKTMCKCLRIWAITDWKRITMLMCGRFISHGCKYTRRHMHVFYELRSHYKITWKYCAEHKHLYGGEEKLLTFHISQLLSFVIRSRQHRNTQRERENKTAFAYVCLIRGTIVFMHMLFMLVHYIPVALVNSLVEVRKVLVLQQATKQDKWMNQQRKSNEKNCW